MKFFTVILLVLAFGPSLLDLVLSGHYVPAPTPVYPTKTFTDASTICKATVQVPPTAVLVRDHNKSARLPILSFSGKFFSIDSTISILTESQVTSSFTSIGGVAYASKPVHHTQTLWNVALHRSQYVSGRLTDEIVVLSLYLWTFFAVGLALLQMRAPHRARLTSEQVAQFEDATAPQLAGKSHAMDGPVELTQHRVAYPPLPSILRQTVPTYQPRAPELADTLLITQDRCLTSEPTVESVSTLGREQSSVRRPHFRSVIARIVGPPSQIGNQVLTPQRARVLVDWINIPSHEGALILYGHSSIATARPTEWTSQWFPRQPHTYYLSDRPANPDSLLLDILLRSISIYHPWAPQLPGVLLGFSGEVVEETGFAVATDSAIELEVAAPLCQSSRPNTPNPRPAVDAPTTSMTSVDDGLDMEWEATGALLERMGGADRFGNTKVEGTSTLLGPSLQSVPVSSQNYSSPRCSQSTYSESEVSTESTLLPGSSFPSQTSAIPSLSYNAAGYQHFPTVYHSYPASSTYHHAPMVYHPSPYGTPVMYQQTPMGYQPYSPRVAYQQFPAVYHQYPSNQMLWQPLTAGQAAAAREAMRSSLPPSAEHASERNTAGLWAPDSTGFEAEAMEENEPEEVPKKKFRRGGKRKTARRLKWEEFERQRRDEGGPEAGASAPN
ncbi:hypothetical protein FS837_010686 [Tulasnella sp. UAMH 9824]|nr:hypothetical protein FS837_010686 [Tulasnella sp. UAMH 9824]